MGKFYSKIRPFSLLFSILGIAFVVRIIAALYFTPPQLTDEKEYLSLAQSIQTGNGFSINKIPTAYRAPAYPSFIAVSFAVLGESITGIRMIQALADTVSCLFVFLIAKRFFSSKTAYVSMLFYAISPGNILYVSLLLSEILFTTLLLVIIFLYTNESIRNSLKLKLLIGALLAILTLLRQNAPMIFFAFVAWELFQFTSWKTVWRRNIIIAVSFVIFLFPWLMRNKIQFDHFSLTSNGGVNFWIGHNEGANGSYRYVLENNPLESINGEFDKSMAGYKEGCTFLMQNPLKELKLLGLKMAHFFEPDFALQYSLQFKPEWEQYANSILIYREFSPLSLIVFHTISMLIILSAFWTMIYSNDGANRYKLLLISVILFWLSLHLIFFGAARFRIPIMPLFIILSAYTFEVVREKQFSFTGIKHLIFSLITAMLIGNSAVIFSILYLPQ